MSEHTGLISYYQLLITAACTNTGSQMKGNHPRAADQCPFVPRRSYVRLHLSWEFQWYADGGDNFCLKNFDTFTRTSVGVSVCTSSILHQALCIISNPSVNSNWSYSPETPNLGQIRQFLEPCDLEIQRMTLKNNRAPLLCCFKLCASFRSH